MQQKQTWHQHCKHHEGDPQRWKVKGSVDFVLAGGSFDEPAVFILL
jgi:hypothetical protein